MNYGIFSQFISMIFMAKIFIKTKTNTRVHLLKLKSEMLAENPVILRVKFDENSVGVHEILLKSGETGSSVSLRNIPPWCDEKTLRRLLGSYGPIDEMTLTSLDPDDPKRGRFGFKRGELTFERPSSLQKCLDKVGKSTKVGICSTEQEAIQVGIKVRIDSASQLGLKN